MNDWTQVFPAVHSSEHYTASASFPPSHSASPPPQVSDTHAPGSLHDVKANVIHQTKPPCSPGPWSSSNTRVPIVHAFSSRRVQHRRSDWFAEISFLLQPALTFSAICASAAKPLIPMCIYASWAPMCIYVPVH